MTTFKSVGEAALIERIRGIVGTPPDAVLGIGDDTAVVPAGPHDWLFTTDPVVEGVHYLPGTDPERVGRKAVNRVLSDIAAMGGEARWLLIDAVAPASYPAADFEAAYHGAAAAAGRFGAFIIGGDMTTGPAFELHVFGAGCVNTGGAVLRSGGHPGDRLYATGSLGGSLAGKHLDFEPRLQEAAWLAGRRLPSAMTDISDGLATDLAHVAGASGCAAEVHIESVPVSEAARAATDGRSPMEHALCDGEDFELLFAVPAEAAVDWQRAWADLFSTACTCIGRLTDAAPPGTVRWLDAAGRPLKADYAGFQHYR